VVLGDEKLLRELHASGDIVSPRDEDGWLLRIAVDHDRPEILKLLLDFGLDPDARVRAGESDDIEFTWGMPLVRMCPRASARHGGNAARTRRRSERCGLRQRNAAV
jgi:hypothetical protein